jgi:hypothetical protein
MRGIHARKQVFFAEELVVVFFGFGIKPRVVIGIPRLRSGRRRHDAFIETANSSRAAIQRPNVIATFGIEIAPADEAGSVNVFREQGVKSEQPDAIGLFEIRIDRQRIDLGTSDEVVAGIVADLEILDLPFLRTVPLVRAVAIIETQVVVVGRDRTEDIVSDDLVGNVGVVGIDQRKWLPRNVTDDAAMVGAEAHLAGVFSVASRYGGGQSIRSLGIMFIDIPCETL